MYEAGLSAYLRGSACPFQLDGQKNLGRDPALRQMADPEGVKRCKAVANRLHKNRRALWLFLLDQIHERSVPGSSASIETPLLPAAMFQVSFSSTLVSPFRSLRHKHVECQRVLSDPATRAESGCASLLATRPLSEFREFFANSRRH